MHPEGLKIEIESAIYRNSVEPYAFKFSFIEKLEKEFALRLTDETYYEKKPFDMETLQKELAAKYKYLKDKQCSLDSIDVYKGIDNVFCVHEMTDQINEDFYLAKYSGSLMMSEIAVFSCAN